MSTWDAWVWEDLENITDLKLKSVVRKLTPSKTKTGSPEQSLCKLWRCKKYRLFRIEYKASELPKTHFLPSAGTPEVIFMSSPKKEAFLPLVLVKGGLLCVEPVPVAWASLSLYLFSAPARCTTLFHKSLAHCACVGLLPTLMLHSLKSG